MTPVGGAASNPKLFRTPAQLREWLNKHHASRSELWVGLRKKSTGKASITWPQLVDQLLCFGWIDGVRKSVDEHVYTIRVTPRRQRSVWSTVNVNRVPELIAQGAMTPAGLAAYEARLEARTTRYAFEQGTVSLGPVYERELRSNRKAWAFFNAQPPGYCKIAAWYVISAKREDTQRRRLEILIRESAGGRRLGTDTRATDPPSKPRTPARRGTR